MSTELLKSYYAAFNAGDVEAMAALCAEDVRHDVNQGGTRVGLDAFRSFGAHMARCYSERLDDIVLFADGDRGAAEFIVDGRYLETDGDLPPAIGQRYRLPAGAFFTFRDGKIARVTTYYNLQDWLAQIGAGAAAGAAPS